MYRIIVQNYAHSLCHCTILYTYQEYTLGSFGGSPSQGYNKGYCLWHKTTFCLASDPWQATQPQWIAFVVLSADASKAEDLMGF